MSESQLKLIGWALVLALAPPAIVVGMKAHEWLPQRPVPSVAEGEPKVLFFTADFCPACRMAKPTVTKLRNSGFPIRTVDVQKDPEAARYFGISGIPAFVYVKDGREVDRLVGAYPADRIRQLMAN